MATFETAYEKVKGLVFAFKENEKTFLSSDYSEARVRDDFIDDFFIALGWDVTHIYEKNPYRQEVKIEKSIADENKRKRRADYAFSLAPNYKNYIFIVEAKKPARALLNTDDYFQSIRYATNTNTPIVVLTDFEEFHVIDARFKTTIDTALHRKIKEYRYHDYADKEKFAEIYYLFSHEAVADNSIQEYAESLPIPKSKAALKTYLPKGTKSVDESLLDELEELRVVLAKAFKKENPSLDSYVLTEATQRTIDRLVFLRFIEDKLLEPELFVSRFARSKTPWKDFTHDCIRLNVKYNGVVFRKHLIDENSFKSPAAKTFIDVCNRLTNPDYYYDVIPIHILGSIYERFLGKVVHATAKRVTVEEKPEVKKAGGVYYTPQYIVEYIIENTIGKLIEGKSPLQISRMRFADIACGSGSFLISVFGYILDYHSNWYNDNPKKAKEDGCIYIKEDDKWVISLKQKREILVNNIYGVDIDEQAVEVTELSLYLKLLEDETTATAHEMSSLFTLLPDISNNILCGNSLIEPDILLSDLFSGEEELKLNPLSFDNAFPDVMAKGGFDAIVGNPPYVFTRNVEFRMSVKEYFHTHYLNAIDKSVKSRGNQTGKVNLYGIFIIRAIHLLNPKGLFGYIIPNTVLRTTVYESVRKYLLDNCNIQRIVDLKAGVFEGVTASTIILLLGLNKNNKKVEVVDNPVNQKSIIKPVKTITKTSFYSNPSYAFNIFVNEAEANLFESIKKKSISLSALVDVFNGIATFKGKQGISKIRINDTYKKLLAGRNIGHYFHSWSGEYIEYVPSKLQRSRNEKIFLVDEKLIMQRIGGILITSYDNEQYYTFNSVNNIIPKETDYSLKFILACLNSKLLRYYYINNFTNKSSLTVNISKTFLDKLPIPNIDFSNKTDTVAHNKIVKLVDQIIEAKKKLATVTSDRDKNYYERRTSSIDREINKEVYKLYSLSKDEIEIINSE